MTPLSESLGSKADRLFYSSKAPTQTMSAVALCSLFLRSRQMCAEDTVCWQPTTTAVTTPVTIFLVTPLLCDHSSKLGDLHFKHTKTDNNE